MRKVIIFCTIFLLMSGIAFAESTRTNRIEISTKHKTGDSNVSNNYYLYNHTYKNDQWKYYIELEKLYQRGDEDSEYAESLTERRVSDRAFISFGVKYETDLYSGYDYQHAVGLGGGYEAIKSDNHNLKLISYVAHHWDKSDTGDVKENSSLNARISYKWNIDDDITFKQMLDGEKYLSEDYYNGRSETSIELKFNKTLSFIAKHSIDYRSEVPDPTYHKTNTTTQTNIVINF